MANDDEPWYRYDPFSDDNRQKLENKATNCGCIISMIFMSFLSIAIVYVLLTQTSKEIFGDPEKMGYTIKLIGFWTLVIVFVWLPTLFLYFTIIGPMIPTAREKRDSIVLANRRDAWVKEKAKEKAEVEAAAAWVKANPKAALAKAEAALAKAEEKAHAAVSKCVAETNAARARNDADAVCRKAIARAEKIYSREMVEINKDINIAKKAIAEAEANWVEANPKAALAKAEAKKAEAKRAEVEAAWVKANPKAALAKAEAALAEAYGKSDAASKKRAAAEKAARARNDADAVCRKAIDKASYIHSKEMVEIYKDINTAKKAIDEAKKNKGK